MEIIDICVARRQLASPIDRAAKGEHYVKVEPVALGRSFSRTFLLAWRLRSRPSHSAQQSCVAELAGMQMDDLSHKMYVALCRGALTSATVRSLPAKSR